MSVNLPYQLLADLVLILHISVVLFVVGGLVVIVVGNIRNWLWVNAPWFRIAHLAAIAFVVAESLLDITCPLTTLEMWLRTQASEAIYSGSFIEHWLQRVLYYDLPAWIFTFSYSLFALLVIAIWWYFPPSFKSRLNERDAEL